MKALPLLCDVGDVAQVNAMVERALGGVGRVDILVSNAAIRPDGPLLTLTYEEWHRVLAIDLHASFYLVKALAPQMIERRSGSIIALGGMGLMRPSGTKLHVTTSKGGLMGMIKGLASELGPHNIRANLLMVGAIDTDRRHPEWYGQTGNPFDSQDVAATPLRRWGTPQDVANVALFFASDLSSFVTGDRVICAGGSLCRLQGATAC